MRPNSGSESFLQTYTKWSEYIELMESLHLNENMVWLLCQKDTGYPWKPRAERRRKTLPNHSRPQQASQLVVRARRVVNWFSANLRRTQDTRRNSFLLCLSKTPTNFGSWRIVCEPFADVAAHICSPDHTCAHLVWEPFGSHACTRPKSTFTRETQIAATCVVNTDFVRALIRVFICETQVATNAWVAQNRSCVVLSCWWWT